MANRIFPCLAMTLAVCLLGQFAAETSSAVGLGGKFGLSFAKQDFVYIDPIFEFKTDTRTGLGAGVFAERSVLPFLSLRAEALYVQKGFKADFTLFTETGDSFKRTLHYRLDYLSIDLLAKASLPTHTYALAGPRLDIKLGIRNDAPDMFPSELEDKFNSTAFGATFGIGQEIPMPPVGAVFVEGQYYLDFGKLYDNKPSGLAKVGTLEGIKNKAFSVFVGVRF